MAQQVTNTSSIHEDVSSIPGSNQWAKDLWYRCRCGSNLVLLLLWLWLADAALIQPLAQALPYAIAESLKRKKKKDALIYPDLTNDFAPLRLMVDS